MLLFYIHFKRFTAIFKMVSMSPSGQSYDNASNMAVPSYTAYRRSFV